MLYFSDMLLIKVAQQEEMMRGKPGYEHLNEPLHILIEAELPVEIIDSRLIQARDIVTELIKPVVSIFFLNPFFKYKLFH